MIFVCSLCYATLKTNKTTISNNIGTIERNIDIMRRAADDVDKRGGNSSEIRAKISFYEKEVLHYRKTLDWMSWI